MSSKQESGLQRFPAEIWFRVGGSSRGERENLLLFLLKLQQTNSYNIQALLAVGPCRWTAPPAGYNAYIYRYSLEPDDQNSKMIFLKVMMEL